ncbi:hypothetical protein Kpol_1035p13 [Vanderwaltozyma polyspora DSM 70294]|uniref:Rho-GAP domain-containing protein n=1 Tax=Vanderwaltozyma polyspora (strain ATCC 22028 / DSM 70294 / BCRC 21397 / CBS 2163 / NBRC 10782 / NRRL Y-8283 / UCD 57-17) TaxID=436907 RepID=A7TKH9_VANPO|nr:uncharacterized protein Kpol_1035p13 [Vanderwaltozyma polyspora DSM 70294]EDO17201.1 hypothetical protein Kpol_1035p13 [Vanderwaltozyma polyspora DSM 70294]
MTGLLESDEIVKVLQLDVATNALLTRLKQSILICEEFTKFTRKKFIIEENYLEELSKQYKHFFNNDSTSITPSSSTLHKNIVKIFAFDGSLAQVRYIYAQYLSKMYDELSSLLLTMTRMRKSLKETSRHLEKNVADAIHLAEKNKNRYYSLCQDWEKLRLVDPTKTKLTLRGSRTTREQEEDLIRKIDIADLDYKQKVEIATNLRNNLLNIERPRIVSELSDLIMELDTAMTIQLQKYSIWTEKLLLDSGSIVSPLDDSPNKTVSMKSLADSITNEKDLYNYLKKFTDNSPKYINKNLIPVTYTKHPSMIKNKSRSSSNVSLKHQPSFVVDPSRNSIPKRMISTHNESPFDGFKSLPSSVTSPAIASNLSSKKSNITKSTTLGDISDTVEPVTSSSQVVKPMIDVVTSANNIDSNLNDDENENSQDLDSIIKSDTSFRSLDPHANKNESIQNAISMVISNTENQISQSQASDNLSLPALSPSPSNIDAVITNPVEDKTDKKDLKLFGAPLENLFEYEQDMVPSIVRQSIHVIDKYGLELEEIYRHPVGLEFLESLKNQVENNPTNVTKYIPPPNHDESDIYLVASLLKLFFSSLPDTLIPASISNELNTCLSIEDMTTRKNYMHGLIYKFPDAQYWTLRSLLFHLKRVIDNEEKNKMNRRAVSIIWGPIILPSNETDFNDVDYHIQLLGVLFDVLEQAFEPE